jgi:hypothetical protein
MWGVIFGSIGLGFFVFGKRQKAAIPLLSGIALMVFPFFISNPYFMVPLGIVFIALPYFIKILGVSNGYLKSFWTGTAGLVKSTEASSISEKLNLLGVRYEFCQS